MKEAGIESNIRAYIDEEKTTSQQNAPKFPDYSLKNFLDFKPHMMSVVFFHVSQRFTDGL